jgi:hypothetical protein
MMRLNRSDSALPHPDAIYTKYYGIMEGEPEALYC